MNLNPRLHRRLLAKLAAWQKKRAAQAANQPEQAANQPEQAELPHVSCSEEQNEGVGKKSITTLHEAAHPEIAELVKNKKLIKKTMTQGNWVFVYLGVHGTMDSVYLKHPCVQELLPRGYYETYFDGVFVFASHGSDKFHDGQERTAPEAGIEHSITLPNKKLVHSLSSIPGMSDKKLPYMDTQIKVIVSDKRNGKNMTFRLFHHDGKLHCFIASKTTCGVFEIDQPIPQFINAHGENTVLINMANAFMRFWNSISEHSKAKLVDACVRFGFTFMVEYEDGAHIVPHSGLPSLTITMVIKVDQSGHTENSEMLFRFGGSSLQEWLCGRTQVGLDPKFVVQSKTFTLKEYATPKTQKVLHWTNIFEAGEPIEGYVVSIVFAGKVVCQFKLKNPVYIILRMIRELLRAQIDAGAELNPAKVAFDLHAKISGPGAYPAGLSGAAADACCDVAEAFAKFCIRLSTERGVPLQQFVSISGNGDDIEEFDCSGMANTMALFVEQNGGFGIPQALALTGDSSGKWAQSTQKETTPAPAPGFVLNKDEVRKIADFILEASNKPIEKAGATFLERYSGVSKFERTIKTTKSSGVLETIHGFPLGTNIAVPTCFGRQKGTTAAPVIIQRGVSGSGKTASASALQACFVNASFVNASIVSADDYFYKNGVYTFIGNEVHKAHFRCQNRAKEVSADEILIVSNTNTSLGDIKFYVELAVEQGRPIVILDLIPVAPIDDAIKCLFARGQHVNATNSADSKTLWKQWNTYTQPANQTPRTFELLCERLNLDATDSSVASTAVPKEPAAVKKPATKKPPTPYTALIVELPPAFRELFSNTKAETHITLNFGEHVRALLDDPRLARLSFTISEVREYIDPDNTANFIACAVVKSDVLDELQKAGLVKDNLHITLAFGGSFKPADSNKLMDGTLKPTRTIPISDDTFVCVGNVAAMPLSK